MSLTRLWVNSPEQIRDKQIHQIIAFAGDGNLRDGSSASAEFRDLLSKVPSITLERYADECLTTKFQDSGLALQDVVNQVGARLGFDVVYGRYRGVRNTEKFGHDGLWRSPTGSTIVVEVKTSDTYSIDLEKVVGYRRNLINKGEIREVGSSILVVVGRNSTGDLEAQIRGSRHAWDIRLISVDALIKLVSVKEDLEDPKILHRIHQILVPREFTRLDDIVEILFSTAEDLKLDSSPDSTGEATAQAGGKKFTPVAFHQACVDRIQSVLGLALIKKSRASFQTADRTTRLVCAVSREHDRSGQPAYWFAFHPHQKDFLEGDGMPFVAFGCGSADQLLLLPFQQFASWLPDFNTTDLVTRFYWHISIVISEGRPFLSLKGGKSSVDLSRFLVGEP